MKYKIILIKDIKEEIIIEAIDELEAQDKALDKAKQDKNIVAYWVEAIEEE